MHANRTLILLVLLTMIGGSAVSAQAPTVPGTDSLLNGALIGAGAGVASHLLVCRTMEPWDVCRNDFGGMLKFGALGAGIGIGIDALVRKSDYRFPSGAQIEAVPLLGRRAKGMRLSVRF